MDQKLSYFEAIEKEISCVLSMGFIWTTRLACFGDKIIFRKKYYKSYGNKSKDKICIKNDQEEMVKTFYDCLGDNKNTFLGHTFPDEDEVDTENNSSDDDDNDEDNKRDDGDEMEEQECKIEIISSNYNNYIIPEEASR